MSRLSIELTPQQHQRLKALAALQGKTIKQYVLERTLPNLPDLDADDKSEAQALRRLEDFLQARVDAADQGNYSRRTPSQIFDDVRNSLK